MCPPSSFFIAVLFVFEVRSEDNVVKTPDDTIGSSVYVDASRNKDRHKPHLSFASEFLSKWAVSDPNLLTDVKAFFPIIGLYLTDQQLFVALDWLRGATLWRPVVFLFKKQANKQTKKKHQFTV